MGRTINVWIVIVVCACMLITFFWKNNQLDVTIEDLNRQADSHTSYLAKLDTENTNLTAELAQSENDDYIEKHARTQYGFMMPDEIRFVIPDLEVEESTNE